MGDSIWKNFEKEVKSERKRIMRIGNPAKRARELSSLDEWARGEAEKLRVLERLETRAWW